MIDKQRNTCYCFCGRQLQVAIVEIENSEINLRRAIMRTTLTLVGGTGSLASALAVLKGLQENSVCKILSATMSGVKEIIDVELSQTSEGVVALYACYFRDIFDSNTVDKRGVYYAKSANRLGACLMKIRNAHRDSNSTALCSARIEMIKIIQRMVLQYPKF